METLYDVQQLFKQFGLYIYVGKRIYDIELMMIELKKLFDARVIDQPTYLKARNILTREHRIEESREDL
ncbi:YqgQ family protein [Enterococcus saccharolyticus]|uniref:DUF910 family protein n=1 Tax=Candidatus Enterococcus willemsii TaxID=1857215 RepID=A0ABQ6YVJ3_9ENTE|nr:MULTISPECIES: YqgQ family protein [Enterococcus]KAF1301102.1 hypothetical protein BAU17_09780 [Enterococcus sp. CU12B]MCD5001091.1 YqgQ family protein [Enterococcus saccharolyticus]